MVFFSEKKRKQILLIKLNYSLTIDDILDFANNRERISLYNIVLRESSDKEKPICNIRKCHPSILTYITHHISNNVNFKTTYNNSNFITQSASENKISKVLGAPESNNVGYHLSKNVSKNWHACTGLVL